MVEAFRAPGRVCAGEGVLTVLLMGADYARLGRFGEKFPHAGALRSPPA
jgi:hypothetical protein